MTRPALHRERVLFRDNGCVSCGAQHAILDAHHHPVPKQALKSKHAAAVIASDKRRLTRGRQRLARAELEDVLWDVNNAVCLCRSCHEAFHSGSLDVPVPKHAREFMAHFDLEPA